MDVYETLAIASPILGLSAFGCAQIVMVLLLRRRFRREEPVAPVQKRLQFGLYAGLIVCASIWTYVFVVCARAVLRETIAGNVVALPLFAFVLACAFAGLVTVSWFSMRQYTKDLGTLAAEIEEISRRRGGLHVAPPQASLSDGDISQHKKKARQAVLYFGASSYDATLELLAATHAIAR